MKKPLLIFIACGLLVATIGIFSWPRTLRPEPDRFPDSHPEDSNPVASGRVSRIQSREQALSERLKAAREISTDLSNQELKELMDFLARPLDPENAGNELLALNQVMDQLRVSGMACGEYAIALCGLIREPQTHPVVRDYAMQHAVQWMRDAKHGHSPAKLAEEDRKRLLDCMVSYLQTPGSSYETGFGTALNLIRVLEPDYPADAADIVAICSSRISDVASGREAAPLGNRVAAIQSLPSLSDRRVAQDMVRKMVAASQADSPVRLVAIATLGSLGDETDLAVLRRIEKEDHNLSYAARSAADRLTVTLASTTR